MLKIFSILYPGWGVVSALMLSACAEQPESFAGYGSTGTQRTVEGSNGKVGEELGGSGDQVLTNPAPPPPQTPAPPPGVAATGTTAISFTPVRYGAAQYPASFIYAVWITDANDRYIKTVDARAGTRMRYLDKWLTSAGVVAPTRPDGVAGASQTYPATPTAMIVNWDMKDKAGTFVAMGNYKVNVQFTSSNNTGLSLVVPVTINAAGMMKTDTSMTQGITNFSAKHTP